MLRKVSPTLGKLRSMSTAASSTVDPQEIENFKKFTAEWWDPFGPMKPLHSMNKLRVPFVRDGILNSGLNKQHACTPTPLKDISILDVGCGGGILSEPLARLGAKVTGLDANSDVIELAKNHARCGGLEITYLAATIEDHCKENAEKYDAVVASEIVEHVTRKDDFIDACMKCLKPNGTIYVTTINKTMLANVLGIMVAENVLGLLPRGTHHYEKFIKPHKLQRILEDNNCRTELVHGMIYNVLTNTWHWCFADSINYALRAVKVKDAT